MRGQTVGLLPLLFIASVVALATLAASAWSQAPLDPQSLVGEWSGSWNGVGSFAHTRASAGPRALG